MLQKTQEGLPWHWRTTTPSMHTSHATQSQPLLLLARSTLQLTSMLPLSPPAIRPLTCQVESREVGQAAALERIQPSLLRPCQVQRRDCAMMACCLEASAIKAIICSLSRCNFGVDGGRDRGCGGRGTCCYCRCTGASSMGGQEQQGCIQGCCWRGCPAPPNIASGTPDFVDRSVCTARTSAALIASPSSTPPVNPVNPW
eukprot:1161955-Pelagomonas_calceolata.AAC.18